VEGLSFYVTIIGNGSYAVPPAKTWRGPATYEITPEQAETILAEKEAGRVGDYVIVSTTKPEVEAADKPDWMLRPEDLAWNRRQADLDDLDISSPDSDYEPAEREFQCPQCAAGFTSAAGLDQHVALKHSDAHRQAEDDVRAELEAVRQRKAVEERIREAAPKILRPEERGPD
jgi:hypothetical protein